MTKSVINLFMWGYQEHFRISVEILTKRVFELIRAEGEPEVLLVGVLRPDRKGHPVCVEPETGKWPLSMFFDLRTKIEAEIPNHPLQEIFYGDEPSMRDKPENMRRLTVASEVKKALAASDQGLARTSFCSTAYPVGQYYVVCVIQIPNQLLLRHPEIRYRGWDRHYYETNLLHSCISVILSDARNALMLPDPGRSFDAGMRSGAEIVRRAAENFLQIPLVGQRYPSGLFNAANEISALMYERQRTVGRVILVSDDDPAMQYVVRLSKPAPIRNWRWARKLLQMSTSEIPLVSNCEVILGLGRKSNLTSEPYSVEFLDHYQWEFRRGDDVFMRVAYGNARLPQEPISFERFSDNLSRLFSGITDEAIYRLHNALGVLLRQGQGSMLVIAADAESEAHRLALQSMMVEATPLTRELLEQASRIDGAILADPNGTCYSIGVVLDGEANPDCTPSRGARYNSAVRYVSDQTASRIAFVISDDRTLDIVPLLRQRLKRSEIAAAIAALTSATLDDYHKPRLFLDEHRFYLNEDQCNRINQALDRIETLPREVGEFVLVTRRFTPDLAMNDTYLHD